MQSRSDSYAAAGVDITAGYKAVELMKTHIAKTMTAGALSDIGGFGGLFELDLTGITRQVAVEDDTLCQMDGETYALHAQEHLPCVCFSSQAKGFLTKMDASGEAVLTDKARRRYLCPENLEALNRARALSRETGLSVNAISLAWLTSQPFPTFPIAGASKMAQLEALREAGDACLTPEQRDSLRRL